MERIATITPLPAWFWPALAALGGLAGLSEGLGRSGAERDAALVEALDILAGAGRLDNGAVVLFGQDDVLPRLRAVRGRRDVAAPFLAVWPRLGELSRPFALIREGAALIEAGPDGDLAADPEDILLLGAPIAAGGRPIGALLAERAPGPGFGPGHEALYLGLAAGVLGALMEAGGRLRRRLDDLARQAAAGRAALSTRFRHVFEATRSGAMAEFERRLLTGAVGEAPVLLVGGPGSGKSVAARFLHELSARAAGPFVAGGGTIAAEEELSRDLYGLAARPGQARSARPGLFEEADGGTLYVRLPDRFGPEAAGRLIETAARGETVREGATRARRVDVRLVVGLTAGQAGRLPFEEFARRLGAFRLDVPALSARPEDILPLAAQISGALAARHGRRLVFSSKALRALQAHAWPGNIREMEELLTRLSLTAAEDRVELADLPPEFLSEGERPEALPDDASALRDMERRQVVSALVRHGFVQARAARELGLTLRQIGYRIRKYGISRDKDGDLA